MLWSQEFNRLPVKIKSTIGTKYFNTNVKKYYKNRCQHQEHTLSLCTGCNNTSDIYQNDAKIKKFNEKWTKENIKDDENFRKRLENWYRGQESGKKIRKFCQVHTAYTHRNEFSGT